MYSFNEVDAGTLRQWLEEESVCLVDVRSPAEMSRGIIGGAQLVPLHLLPVRVDALVEEKPVRLVFYCQSGARSAQACAFVSQRHAGEVYNLRAGIMGWVTAGHPLAAPEALTDG